MKDQDDETDDPTLPIKYPHSTADDVRRAEAAKAGSPYLDTKQAAHYLRISPRTLQKKCRANIGPLVRWIGDRRNFLVRDLDDWSLRKH